MGSSTNWRNRGEIFWGPPSCVQLVFSAIGGIFPEKSPDDIFLGEIFSLRLHLSPFPGPSQTHSFQPLYFQL